LVRNSAMFWLENVVEKEKKNTRSHANVAVSDTTTQQAASD
jgi:hypothetical protein